MKTANLFLETEGKKKKEEEKEKLVRFIVNMLILSIREVLITI